MRFKIDEHLPVEIKELLTRHQHDAVTVPDEGMTGAIDPDVAQACRPVPDVPPLRCVPVVQTVDRNSLSRGQGFRDQQTLGFIGAQLYGEIEFQLWR